MGFVVASNDALSLLTATTSAEQVSGTYQFTGPGTYSLWAKGSATGMNVTCIIGGTIMTNDNPIPYTGTAGTLDTSANPIFSQRILGLNNKAELKFRNTSAGTLTVGYLLLWDPFLGGLFKR